METVDLRLSRAWFTLAYVALLSAGAFAIAIVLARVPVLDRYMGDPGLFKRILVVHVTFALVLWFYAFLSALYHRVPMRGTVRFPHWGAVILAGISYLMIMVGSGVRGAEPLLVNYIPVIATPSFTWGLVVFGLAVGLPMLDWRLWSRENRDAASILLRGASLAYLLALCTFALTWGQIPQGLEIYRRAELGVWGGGHVLQFANVFGMLCAWELLLERSLGRDRLTSRATPFVSILLVLPLFAAPFNAMENPAASSTFGFYTRLMQWGIFPAVSLWLLLAFRRLGLSLGQLGWRKVLGDARVLTFLSSAALTVIGFLLGSMIRGQTTVIPGHYHAAIGGVTVAYMGASFLLLEDYGQSPTGRFAAWIARAQPIVYGAGQIVFAFGFALAGAHGMERKVYGAEQQIRTFGETLGLGVMGLGGLIAIVGGVMLLMVVVPALFRSTRSAAEAP